MIHLAWAQNWKPPLFQRTLFRLAGTVYAKVCRSLIARSSTETAEARIPFVAAGTLLPNAWTAGGRFARSAERSAAEIHSASLQGPDRGMYPEPATIIRDAAPLDTKRAEMCVGLGGHNDYWNRTAPDIAEKLDKLIQM